MTATGTGGSPAARTLCAVRSPRMTCRSASACPIASRSASSAPNSTASSPNRSLGAPSGRQSATRADNPSADRQSAAAPGAESPWWHRDTEQSTRRSAPSKVARPNYGSARQVAHQLPQCTVPNTSSWRRRARPAGEVPESRSSRAVQVAVQPGQAGMDPNQSPAETAPDLSGARTAGADSCLISQQVASRRQSLARRGQARSASGRAGTSAANIQPPEQFATSG
jgi:hypothetical protein